MHYIITSHMTQSIDHMISPRTPFCSSAGEVRGTLVSRRRTWTEAGPVYWQTPVERHHATHPPPAREGGRGINAA